MRASIAPPPIAAKRWLIVRRHLSRSQDTPADKAGRIAAHAEWQPPGCIDIFALTPVGAGLAQLYEKRNPW